MDTSFSLAPSERRTRYEALLSVWCRALLDLQVGEQNASVGGLRGGILCPACSRIHGRCADAVYPLLYLARAQQSEAYKDAAIRLLEWSHLVTAPDGAFLNEPMGNPWKGITVFSLLSLGEALRHHGDLLDEATADKWRDRLRRGADFLMGFIDSLWKSNINYPISAAAALAVSAHVLENPSYRQRAHDLLHECLPYFSAENTLLFGEGKPMDGISPRGCRAVDLGYNVEESLPNLALAAHLLGDSGARAVAVRSLQTHLHFLLPDGAWDNSWGSRSFKWTYWGSRTSDGCQSALALLADEDERFLPAADRNLSLLESCTTHGILYSGPHLHEHGDLPCIHHTFCHAKALAAALDTPALQRLPEVPLGFLVRPVTLPRDTSEQPIRHFPEIDTGLVAFGPWRATITAYDWKYSVGEEHPSGGALCLLWHEAVGPIFAASMTTYRELEPSNMQPLRGGELPRCLTPRLVWEQKGVVSQSLLDNNVKVEYSHTAEQVLVTVRGHLTADAMTFELQYHFGGQGVEIAASVEGIGDEGKPVLLELPLIASHQETVRLLGDRQASVEKVGGSLVLTSDVAFYLPNPASQRYFNPVPGFEDYLVCVPVIPGTGASVRLKVQ